MKKTYQTPETLLAALALEQMMIGSNNYGKPEEGQDLSTVGDTDATSGNLSRRRTVWEDEELNEEEEF